MKTILVGILLLLSIPSFAEELKASQINEKDSAMPDSMCVSYLDTIEQTTCDINTFILESKARGKCFFTTQILTKESGKVDELQVTAKGEFASPDNNIFTALMDRLTTEAEDSLRELLMKQLKLAHQKLTKNKCK
ncbi:MAG: hypothetical protein ISR65_10520 [Bacteriovoracaceae bacterium]|nr:hypothetical protein [Bacteriovoracaceae bacterium]